MPSGKNRGNTDLPPEDHDDQGPKPWDRQPGETDKAFAAFRVYLEAGPHERSYRSTAAVLGKKSDRWLKRWGVDNDWAGRVTAWDDHCAAIRIVELEKSHRLDLEEVRTELLALHRKAISVSRQILDHCETVLASCVELDEDGRLVAVIPLDKIPTFARAASAVANTSIEGAGAVLAIDDVLDVTSGVE